MVVGSGYDTSLGRWAQPDSIIPNPYDSQSWDRYAYVNNNAVRYTDPTGHRVDEGCDTEGCELRTSEDYTAYSAGTIEFRFKSSLRHKGVAANSLVEKIYSGNNPVSRATLLAWATGNVAQGGPNVKLALTDLMLVSMSNLSTGLMAASMGGDLAPVGPGIIYRAGRTNPSNLKPRQMDEGMLSFRDSISNPWPLEPGERPVFSPGDDFIAVDSTKLPDGSVVFDNNPPGHVSVNGILTSVETIKNAVLGIFRFP